MNIPDQSYEVVPVDAVKPHPDNPRRGDTGTISDSFEVNGWYGAIVAQRSTGHILVGNHRHAVLKEKGAADVPVIFLDIDDDRARRILLMDNRSADRAEYDKAGLLTLLEELAGDGAGLAGTGYDLDALEDLRFALDAVPTTPVLDTGAHYAETPEEEDARVAALGGNSRNLAGLRELVVVLPIELHATALARLAVLRKAAGEDTSAGEVVLAALLTLTEDDAADAIADVRSGVEVPPEAAELAAEQTGEGDG